MNVKTDTSGRNVFLARSSLQIFPLNYLTTAKIVSTCCATYEGWNFNSGNYLFTTDTK